MLRISAGSVAVIADVELALTRKMRLPGDGDGAQTNYALGNVTDQGRITR